jgi:hypothetical protein
VSQNLPESFSPANEPEEINPTDYLEILDVLDLSILNVGDCVVLYFDDGQAYALTINEKNEHDELFARLSVGSKTQLAKEIERWKDNPHRIQVKGSCDGLLLEPGKTTIVGEQEGVFISGSRAWLGFTADSGEKQIVSHPIDRIFHKKANKAKNTTNA